MPYRAAMKREHIDNTRRFDLYRDGGAVVLVFVPTEVRS
jgi:hypothetical protein